MLHGAAPCYCPALVKVCFSPSCEVLVSGGYDSAVKVWDCRSRSIDAIQVMKPFQDSVTSVTVTDRCVDQLNIVGWAERLDTCDVVGLIGSTFVLPQR